MQKQAGFTLIELIIVLAILSIMAAVGIPNYLNWLPDIRLKSAARNLKSDMMLAQQRAIRLNASVAVLLFTGSNSYRVFVDNNPADDTKVNNWVWEPGDEELLKEETMPTDVGMDLASFGGAARVRFDGRGLPDQGGEVRLSNTKNVIRRITLSITGRATIDISTDGGGTWVDGE